MIAWQAIPFFFPMNPRPSVVVPFILTLFLFIFKISEIESIILSLKGVIFGSSHIRLMSRWISSPLRFISLLFEYSLLKKNTNQFKSALEILSKLKVISPKNIFARELIIDILITINNKQLAQKELNEMMKSKSFDSNKLIEIKDKFELW